MFHGASERIETPLPDVTVGDIVQGYIADRTPDVADPERLEISWKALRPVFEYLSLTDITKVRCRAYAAGRDRAPSTVHTELAMMRSAFYWAEREGWIEKAPYVWLPKRSPPRERYLSDEEVERLLNAYLHPHLKLFTQIALGTGARSASILQLTWDRVEFRRGLIDFRTDPRTNKRNAIVGMNSWLADILRDAHSSSTTDYVIEWLGKPVKRIKKGFSAAATRAGLDKCTPHVLRHTAAVRMAERRVPMSEIAAMLGHSDSRLTERVYAKYSPEYLKRAAESLRW
jgi:integrase